MKSLTLKIAVWVCVCGLMAGQAARAAGGETFASPDDALKALKAAVEATNHSALDTIFGPGLRTLISSDAVQASNRFNRFAQRLSQKVVINHESDQKATLNIGWDSWPFPIPIVQRDGRWFFDTAAGREEILNRRIGFNEMGAIAVCHAYVQAQREYASQDFMGDGVVQYAQQLRSTHGKHDGLYWHADAGQEMSPLGPLVAAAHGEGYRHTTKIMNGEHTPYHGYFFKIITRQGRHAPGGKYNYIINGHMVAGFALVAWPAEWDNSGVMTFIVNQDDKVFEKNLGVKTEEIARNMTVYDPDSSWRPAERQ